MAALLWMTVTRSSGHIRFREFSPRCEMLSVAARTGAAASVISSIGGGVAEYREVFP